MPDCPEAAKDFQTLPKADGEIKNYLSGAEIDGMFDMGCHTKHIDTNFAQVFA